MIENSTPYDEEVCRQILGPLFNHSGIVYLMGEYKKHRQIAVGKSNIGPDSIMKHVYEVYGTAFDAKKWRMTREIVRKIVNENTLGFENDISLRSFSTFICETGYCDHLLGDRFYKLFMNLGETESKLYEAHTKQGMTFDWIDKIYTKNLNILFGFSKSKSPEWEDQLSIVRFNKTSHPNLLKLHVIVKQNIIPSVHKDKKYYDELISSQDFLYKCPTLVKATGYIANKIENHIAHGKVVMDDDSICEVFVCNGGNSSLTIELQSDVNQKITVSLSNALSTIVKKNFESLDNYIDKSTLGISYYG